MKREEFLRLVNSWLNGEIDEREHAELQRQVRDSPQYRKEFLRLTNLDAGLRDLGARNHRKVLWSEASPVKAVAFPRWTLALAAVTVLSLALVAFLVLAQRDRPPLVSSPKAQLPPDHNVEAMGQGFAVLTRAVNAQWAGASFDAGDVLTAETLMLDSGLAQVEFFAGATIVLEGPGELEIRSSSEAFCRSGKLRAVVSPAAKGFVIDTPNGRVVDLGTEFGLEIGTDSTPAVHVFEGKVRLHSQNGTVREITQGDAIVSGKLVQADSAGFVSPSDLEDQLTESNRRQYAQWQAFSRKLCRDPRLIAYFPMIQPDPWNRRLVNAASTGSEFDGAIVGAERVSGRWNHPDKSALQFTPTGSRVRLSIDGEYTSLTFVCWVQINSLDRKYNALYLTDGYDPGEPHWQLESDGRLHFSLRNPRPYSPRMDHYVASFSPPVWDLSQSGRWMHLAAVFDEPAQEIRHYVDGKRIWAEPIPVDLQIHNTRLGESQIGNWGLPNNRHYPIRNLNGRIDEFAVFADALSDKEIADFYEAGNPR